APEFGIFVRARRLEPGMLIGSVVDHEIDDDSNTPLLCLIGEVDEIAGTAVLRIHTVVVRDVISVIEIRRRLKRLKPDAGDTESGEIVQTAGNTLEVADSVTVGIHKGPNVQTVDNGVLVPEIINHGSCSERKWKTGSSFALTSCGLEFTT